MAGDRATFGPADTGTQTEPIPIATAQKRQGVSVNEEVACLAACCSQTAAFPRLMLDLIQNATYTCPSRYDRG